MFSISNDIVGGGQHQMREREFKRRKHATKEPTNTSAKWSRSKEILSYWLQIAEPPPRSEFAEKQGHLEEFLGMQSTLGLLEGN